MNYFEFLGIPLSFHPDESAMQKAYYQNSKKFHPDFHSLADDEKQAWAMENATINNAAFTTLSDPDKRIRYILELKGLLSDESQQPALPPAFLMEMMDINEAIMDLQMDFDAARFEKTIAEVEKTENQLLINVILIIQKRVGRVKKNGVICFSEIIKTTKKIHF